MAKVGRDPIKDGLLQTDLEGGGYNIVNVNAVGNKEQATLIVDPSLPVEIGARGTGLPFRTLPAAVAKAMPGDVIILRPGVHEYDGYVDIFHLDDLAIIGYGAIITSQTAMNEGTKILVRSTGVSISGIKFDGEVDLLGTINQTEGAVELAHAQRTTIKDCWFYRQSGGGIYMHDGFTTTRIHNCLIQSCSFGIYAQVTDTNETLIRISNNQISGNRLAGVLLNGGEVANNLVLNRILISGNEIFSNNSAGGISPGLVIDNNCRGILVSDNYITTEYIGLQIGRSQDVTVVNNVIRGCQQSSIQFIGCQGVVCGDNVIDGRNSSGTPVTTLPIQISGFFAATNDSGPFVLSGNLLINLKNTGFALSVANGNNISIVGNRIQGALSLSSFNTLSVIGNSFTIPVNTQAILIDAAERGWTQCMIEGNRFRFGATIGRVVATVDASATGGSDLSIIGNVCPAVFTYGTGTYAHSGSNAATNVVRLRNLPVSRTGANTDGWLNSDDEVVVNTVIVSQSRGVDASGLRNSGLFPFKTLMAAITAATAGDTVLVKDGVFDERIDAKHDITVRFLPSATLFVVNANGCLRSTAINQVFSLYHEHAPIRCTRDSTTAIDWTHAGANLNLHASLNHTGAGTLPIGLRVSNGTVEVWGYVNAIGVAISTLTGTPVVTLHGGLSGVYDINSGNSLALSVLAGEFKAENATINGGGAHGVALNTSTAGSIIFKRCTIRGGGSTSPAISISTVGSTKPILRDCVLVAGASATASISAGSAQNIILYGQTVANKGSDPPSNVTFQGGGTYDVDANVVID